MPIPAATVATVVPIAMAAASEIHQGIQRRKERNYNSPAEQVKRLRQAGLPTSAGSNISGGQVQMAQVGRNNYGGDQLNDNLSKSMTRSIDKQKLEIDKEVLRAAKIANDIAEDAKQNKLNPSGQFTGTNQAQGMQQDIATQGEALKTAEIVNKYMPIEKAQGIMKQGKEIKQISANIRNTLMSNKIQIEDYKIKKILANYQENMSLNELQSLIKRNLGQDLSNKGQRLRNEGMSVDNSIKRIAYNIEWQTQVARIQMAKNAALASGQSLEAGRLSLLLQNASLPSTQAYYEIRREMDDATKRKPNLANTLLYLGMFQPTTSNYNFGQLMPSIPSGGNTYNYETKNYIPTRD